MLGVYSLFVALTTIAIALRVYTRTIIVKKFGVDDYLAAASWAIFILFATFALIGVHHGTGQHAQNIQPPTEIPIGIKYWWLCEPVYVASNMCIKAAIAVQLLRLTVIRTHRIIIWTTLAVTELYSGFFFFLFIFQCQPSSYFWTQYTGGRGTCIDTTITINAVYAYSAITCLSDWIYAIIPWFLAFKLQMNQRSKITVALILSIGAIASTATIIRIPYVHTLGNLEDFLYATTDVAIWSCVETGLGITAASLATLRPLFRTWLANSSLGSASRRNGGASGGLPGSIGAPRHGYVKGHSRGASTGLEELDLGIRKTTRVSVDEFRHWDAAGQDLETDGESTKSETSKTRITGTQSSAAPADQYVCPWDRKEASDVEHGKARELRVVGSAWAEGRVRR